MRYLWIAALALSTVGASFAQEFSVTAIVQKSGLSWEEAVGAILLAKALDLDFTMVISTRRQSATSVFVLAPAFVIVKASKKDVKDILKERSRGHGWGVIAHRLGVHPGAFNKARVNLIKLSDDDLESFVWLSVLSQVFGCPQSQLIALRQKGLSWGELIATLQIASGANKDPSAVLEVWRKTKDWSKVRAHFGVSPDWLPALKVQSKGKESPGDASELRKGRGHGKGHGKR